MADDEAPGTFVVLEQHPLGRMVGAPTQRCSDSELPESCQPLWMFNLQLHAAPMDAGRDQV